MLSQRTQVWFPVPMSGSSLLPVTPVPGDSTTYVTLHFHASNLPLHICIAKNKTNTKFVFSYRDPVVQMCRHHTCLVCSHLSLLIAYYLIPGVLHIFLMNSLFWVFRNMSIKKKDSLHFEQLIFLNILCCVVHLCACTHTHAHSHVHTQQHSENHTMVHVEIRRFLIQVGIGYLLQSCLSWEWIALSSLG